MKIIICLALFIYLAFSACIIPPNCEIYASSINACIMCSLNYVLVNNVCLMTVRSLPVVNNNQNVLTTTTGSGSTGLLISGTTTTNSNPTTTTTSGSSSNTGYVVSGNAVTNLPLTTTTTNSGGVQTSQTYTGNSFVAIGDKNNEQYKDDNCKTVHQSKMFCSLCYNYYYFNRQVGKCITANTNCRTYNEYNWCTSCFDGNMISSNGDCIYDPNYKGTVITTGATGATGTTGTTSSSGATSTTGTIKTGTTGITGTTNANTNTNTVISNSDKFCSNNTNGLCFKCYKGYYVNLQKNLCELSKPQCRQLIDDFTNLCKYCFQGYLPIAGSCYPQNSGTPIGFVSGSSGISGTTTISSGGSTGSSTVGSTGSSSGGSTGGSSTTNSGSSSGASNTNSNKADLYCSNQINGICQKCYKGYYVNRQKNLCQLSNPDCRSLIDDFTNQCYQCYHGYSVFNGGCIQTNLLSSSSGSSTASSSTGTSSGSSSTTTTTGSTSSNSTQTISGSTTSQIPQQGQIVQYILLNGVYYPYSPGFQLPK